ncbi:HutR like protein [Photobacterium marinum]|uniref:HutR like protein n=1 Tax=Photobacterium marinum TaxID=1056511 RepID=L8JDN4_9GAMM|nr:DUF1566 domain-containing protein [Photobacterium marinum]ELR65639.1 HutR like protein [Photobacterium marinum]
MKKQILGLVMALLPAFSMAQECRIDMGKTAPNVRYSFNDNGTLYDRVSGLTWMRCPLGKTWIKQKQSCEGKGSEVFWQAALSDVEAINNSESHALHQFGGKKQWRLPNIKELVSLTEHGCRRPSMNGKAFASAFPYETNDGSMKAYIWSNTPTADGSQIFTFDSINGEIFPREPSGLAISVLLVSDE